MEFLDTVVLNNSIESWLKAVAVAVFTALALRALVPRLIRRMTHFARVTATHVDDAFVGAAAATKGFFYVVAGIYAAGPLLVLRDRVDTLLQQALLTAVLLQLALWVVAGYRTFLARARETRFADDREIATSFNLLRVLGSVLVWLFTLVFVLQVWGVDVTALLTGLGIGGIAVALAVNSILADLFASLSIIFDKPFLVGDFLIIGDYKGTVRKIGLRSTQLESLSGEQLVFANSDLLNSRIRNYGRMEQRRAAFSFGIVYETEPDLVEQVPAWVREIVEAEQNTRFDRCHLLNLGQWALEFETVYYVAVPDYTVFADVQERVNLALLRKLDAAGVEFAYPTNLQYERRMEDRDPKPTARRPG